MGLLSPQNAKSTSPAIALAWRRWTRSFWETISSFVPGRSDSALLVKPIPDDISRSFWHNVSTASMAWLSPAMPMRQSGGCINGDGGPEKRRTQSRKKHIIKQSKGRIPKFKTVEEEAEFWDTHSTTEFEDGFEDVSDVQFVVTRAQPKKGITVRLDEDFLAILRQEARQKGVGPSTLIRM